MAQYPDEVRLVIRYAPFHPGSDQVVKLLESSKAQGKYLAVLEAVLAAQPAWADHGQPNIENAFKVAEQAGLNLTQARQDIEKPCMQALLQQDIEDLTALQVRKTPTFFINGRSLPSFGPDQLAALVVEEVAKTKR
jgi:protein-disulfide isomerase